MFNTGDAVVISKLQFIMASSLFLAGTLAGATLNGWRWEAKLATAEAGQAQQISEIVNAATRAATDALERQRTALNRLAEIDTQYTQELADAKSEADDLRAAVADGQRQLRIAASCSNSGGDPMRSATTTARVDDVASPRLDDAAERDYWRLRDRIALITTQVSGLQAYIRNTCIAAVDAK